MESFGNRVEDYERDSSNQGALLNNNNVALDQYKRMKDRFNAINKVDDIDKRLDQIEERFDRLEELLGKLINK